MILNHSLKLKNSLRFSQDDATVYYSGLSMLNMDK